MSKESDDQSFVPEDEATASDAPPSEPGSEEPVEQAGDEGDESVNALEEQLTADVDAVQIELQAAQDRTLRVQAELENYRKRAQRTLAEERRYASLPLMRDLLGVVDNLKRALDAAQQNEGSAGLLEGVTMVAEQLETVLKQHHCLEIPTEGMQFDPNLHEAIAQFPCEGHEPGAIAQVTQVGYQLHDRVVRPSQVIVAAEKPESE